MTANVLANGFLSLGFVCVKKSSSVYNTCLILYIWKVLFTLLIYENWNRIYECYVKAIAIKKSEAFLTINFTKRETILN